MDLQTADIVEWAAARNAPGALLRADGLSKGYDDGAPIFRDVSLSIQGGSVVAIIGPNGAGKSTLLRCCVRLTEPDTGAIHLGEQCLTELSARQLRRARAGVGFVFQKHQLVGRMSVLSNVLHGALGRQGGIRLWSQALAPQPLRERALHCLAQVGLAELASRRADQLSGGQSQRVAIARALMQQPELIFADEPAASLDPRAGVEIMELLQRLSRDTGVGVLLVSHDMEHTRRYSDRILGLRDQRLQLDARSRDCSIAELKAFF